MNKVIVINIERCMGCHSCELACAVAHSASRDLIQTIQNGEKPGSRIAIEAYENKAIPIHCHHCELATCMVVCPSGAIHRKGEKEPVLIDTEKCIGCKMCVQACPFGMIILNPEGKGVLKCDFCIERLEEDLEPACVQACPSKALLFVEDNEINRSKRKKVARVLVLMQDGGGYEE
jgi:carbon-monoxide dehydrogenase iron sulfur subunit